MVRRLLGNLAFLLLVAVAVAVCSQQLILTTVMGESMQTTMFTGDLAVVTPGTPEVGDVILYRAGADYAEAAGGDVIHRVIEVTENGYLTKGDNPANQVDPEVPAEAVRGIMRFHIPEVGGWLRTPAVAGAIAGVAVLAIVWPSSEPKEEETAEEQEESINA